MSKSIIESIVENQPAKVVSFVEKALAKKLVRSISEQASVVARNTYGSLYELYGADDRPEFMNNDDNTYAKFYADALQKFGVQGPEDFRDDVTKQRFFDYVDHNWRAQDSVQNPIQGYQGSTLEKGTNTALPPPATQPMAPVAPAQGPTPTTAQGNDPSVATMASAGPSIDKTSPLDQSGQDPDFNGVQDAGGYGDDGSGMGEPDNVCPVCHGTGQAVCPTCKRPHGDQGMGGGTDDLGMDQDPDLEIGDDDQMGSGDDEDMMGGNPDDEMMAGGDDEGDVKDGGDEEELDDPFDDEDAYTIDASDFQNAGNGDGDDEEGEGDEDEDEDENENENGDEEGDGEDFDNDGDDDTSVEGDTDQDYAGAGDDEEGDEDQDEDQDDEDEDDDGSDEDDQDDQDNDDQTQEKSFGEALKLGYSRKERKPASKKIERAKAKKEARLTEDFGFESDNAEDDAFMATITEALAVAATGEGDLGKLIAYVQDQLSRIKKLRNTMLMQLRRQRSVIKKDPALDDESKMDALKQLASMAKDNRKFFKNQAKLVKAMFTGNLGGGEDEGGDFGGDDGDEEDQDQQGNFGGNTGDEGDDEEGSGQDFGADSDDDSEDEGQDISSQDADDVDDGSDEDQDEYGDEDDADENSGPIVGENELLEYGNVASIESKMRMLQMQIATTGDQGGKRRMALNKLASELKQRKG